MTRGGKVMMARRWLVITGDPKVRDSVGDDGIALYLLIALKNYDKAEVPQTQETLLHMTLPATGARVLGKLLTATCVLCRNTQIGAES